MVFNTESGRIGGLDVGGINGNRSIAILISLGRYGT